ncbi:MAG: response regulator transcription factor [Nitrospirae bacterium]|nr:response regulator transcription factor [Nitrospirota bacterium]
MDDHPPIQEGLRELLARAPGFAVVGVAGCGAEALAWLKDSPPDVVLLDWFLPDTTGPQLIPQILAQTPRTKILVYTGQPDEAVTLAALRAGAHGFLSKAEPLETLHRAIRAVAEGEVWADRHTVARYLRELRARVPDPVGNLSADLPALTPREQEAARLAAQGDSNKEMAEKLGVCEGTVKIHLHHLFQKLHVTNRTQLIRLVLQQRERDPHHTP